MDLTSSSKNLVYYLQSTLLDSRDAFSKKNVSINAVYKKIFHDIQQGIRYANRVGYDRQILKPFNAQKSQLFDNNPFMPDDVTQFINNENYTQVVYSCKIKGRYISILFHLYGNDDRCIESTKQQVRDVIAWLYICDLNSCVNCSERLKIFIYFTPFVKTIPDNNSLVLCENNVNTGATYRCIKTNEIIIFRKEEWFKVLLHETIHAYGLDFNSNTQMKDDVKNLFPIKSDFLLEEAYVEFWARVMNAAYICYRSVKSFNTFCKTLDIMLQYERMYAIHQCNKVLHFMGLGYKDLYSDSEHLKRTLYNEKTNVFPYYILTAILFNRYWDFLSWCNNAGTLYIKYNSTINIEKKNTQFIEYIRSNHNNSRLLTDLSRCHHSLLNLKDETIRNSLIMSVFEFEYLL